MRFFDAGQEAHGFIAVGQFATGVIAIGQVATGVFALGQLARGVVAVGQVSIGVFSVGMGSVGVCYAVAMLGAGGRGKGLVLPLIPSLGPRVAAPELVAPAALLEGVREEGWIEAVLAPAGEGRVTVRGAHGGELPVRFDARLRRAVSAHAAGADPSALLRVRRDGEGLLADRVVRPPRTRLRSPGWWAWWGLQLLGLCAVSVAFWVMVARPLMVFLVRGVVVPF